MTDLTPNHPAVEAAARSAYERAWCGENEPWSEVDDLERDEWRADEAHSLTAALPHLTADDLRDTDAADEICTEGWLQGWAAGRDLDGDEDATPYLRDTPAGRALMAEGWREATLWIRYRDGRWPQDMEDANPYREETRDDHA